MGYRDKKNPWHILFDNFRKDNKRYQNIDLEFHPLIYPVIEVVIKNGKRYVYNGQTRKKVAEMYSDQLLQETSWDTKNILSYIWQVL